MVSLLADGLGEHNGVDLLVVALIAGVLFPLLAILTKNKK
jgi:hypothetical protein